MCYNLHLSFLANAMLSIANMKNWVVMVPHQLGRDAQNFIQLVMRAARGMCMQMSEPRVHQMQDDRQGTYVNQLEQVLSHFNPQLVVCCVTNNRADRYSAIKKKCCVDRAGTTVYKYFLPPYPHIIDAQTYMVVLPPFNHNFFFFFLKFTTF
jgi:aubergine-like protein